MSLSLIFLKGRLDYLSEGLMIITNDGDLARTLEMPSYRLERVTEDYDLTCIEL